MLLLMIVAISWETPPVMYDISFNDLMFALMNGNIKQDVYRARRFLRVWGLPEAGPRWRRGRPGAGPSPPVYQQNTIKSSRRTTSIRLHPTTLMPHVEISSVHSLNANAQRLAAMMRIANPTHA
jgi:hypothetical protein